MEKERYFEATEFENIKEIIENAAQKYGDHTAFIIKQKEEKNVNYKNISYAKLLEDIYALGTAFYHLGYQDKRIAVAGRNRYEWLLTHYSVLSGNMVSVPLDKELPVDELEDSFQKNIVKIRISNRISLLIDKI